MNDFKKSTKTVVYINGFAALTLEAEDIQKLLQEEVDKRDVFLFRNDVRYVPVELYNTLGKTFYNGICHEQMALLKERDGIFVNPFILGYTADYEIWTAELLQEKDNFQIIYLDIPYGLYLEGRNESYNFVDEKEYNMNSEATKKLVNAVKNSIKESTVYH